jgi:hypothetical protein
MYAGLYSCSQVYTRNSCKYVFVFAHAIVETNSHIVFVHLLSFKPRITLLWQQ